MKKLKPATSSATSQVTKPATNQVTSEVNKLNYLLKSTMIMALATASSSAWGVAGARTVISTGGTADLGTGVGLSGGNIPAGAVKIGSFIIPNGKSKNPSLTNNTSVNFTPSGDTYIPTVNGMALQGEGAAAFFGNSTLNHGGDVQARDFGGGINFAESKFVGGINDEVILLTAQYTGSNSGIASDSNGEYNITNTNSKTLQFIITPSLSVGSYNNSYGHYFANATGNPLSGMINFVSLKDAVTNKSTATVEYTGPGAFVSGSTLQFMQAATAVANVEGVNIAAVDVGPAPVGGKEILHIQNSASLGSVVNTKSNANRLLVTVASGKTVTVTGEQNSFVFDNGGLATILATGLNNYTGLQSINGSVAGAGGVKFINPVVEMVFNPDIGNENRIDTLTIAGESLRLMGNLSVKSIDFTSANTLNALKLMGNVDLGDTKVTSNSTLRKHNIHVLFNQNISGPVGSIINPLGTIKLLADNRLKVNTLSFYTDVSTAANNTGIVEFTKTSSAISIAPGVNGVISAADLGKVTDPVTPFSYSLGDSANALKEIRFTENAEVRGSAYGKSIIIAAGKIARFVKRTGINQTIIVPYVRTVDGMQLGGNGSIAFFGDLGSVRGNITTAVAGQGIVIFEGGAEVRGDIGTAGSRVSNVSFVANSLDKNIILARDIHANNIIFNRANVVIDAGGTIDGNVLATNTSLTLGQRIEIFTGGTATFTGATVCNIYFDNKSNSHVTVSGAGSKIDLSGASLTFNITDNSLPPPSAGRVYNFFRQENGGILTFGVASKVTVNQPANPFVLWSYDNGALKQKSNVLEGLQRIITLAGGNPATLTNALKFADPASGGKVSTFISDLVLMASTDPVKAGQTLNKLIQATNPTSAVVISTTTTAQSSIVNTRIGGQNFSLRVAANDGERGVVAAGDEDSAMAAGDIGDWLHGNKGGGVWASPFYTHATQRQRGAGEAGYKSTALGGTIGIDGKTREELMLGIAATFANTKVKYRNNKKGDISKIHSIIGSLYGLYDFQNNWLLYGIGSVAHNQVKNSKLRLTTSGTEFAHAKYKPVSYSMELIGGYNIKISDLTLLTPLAGARYSRFNGSSYRESGTAFQDLQVKKKAVDKMEGIAGIRWSTERRYESFTIIPEAHVSVNHDFRNKRPGVSITLEGLASPIKPVVAKPAKTSCELGVGSTSRHYNNQVELGFDLNMTLLKKYTGYQTALRIRANF